MQSAQNSEEIVSLCSICYEDVYVKNDLFGILDCCDHIHCFSCIHQWNELLSSQFIQPTCPFCRRTITLLVPSVIPLNPCSQQRKREFIDFSVERREEVVDHFTQMGVSLNLCPFNCGFAEDMGDGNFMCPHGIYEKERFEEEQNMDIYAFEDLHISKPIEPECEDSDTDSGRGSM